MPLGVISPHVLALILWRMTSLALDLASSAYTSRRWTFPLGSARGQVPPFRGLRSFISVLPNLPVRLSQGLKRIYRPHPHLERSADRLIFP